MDDEKITIHDIFLPKYFVMSEKNVIFVMSKGNNNINTNSL